MFALLRRLVLRILLVFLFLGLLLRGVLLLRGGIVLGGVLFLIGIRLLRVLCRLLDGREVFLGRLLRLADGLAHAALCAGWTARVRLQRHFLLRLVRRETFLEPLENVFAAVRLRLFLHDVFLGDEVVDRQLAARVGASCA